MLIMNSMAQSKQPCFHQIMWILAKENEYLQEAAQSLYVANADEIVRQQCIAREDAERRERTLERLVMQKQEKIEEQEKENKRLRALLEANGILLEK